MDKKEITIEKLITHVEDASQYYGADHEWTEEEWIEFLKLMAVGEAA